MSIDWKQRAEELAREASDLAIELSERNAEVEILRTALAGTRAKGVHLAAERERLLEEILKGDTEIERLGELLTAGCAPLIVCSTPTAS
jgi:pyrimidine operon attenuation protein/uracil phosphoribosyltransferase